MQRYILFSARTELFFSVSLMEVEPAALWVHLGCYSVPGSSSLGGMALGGIIIECAEPWLVFLILHRRKAVRRMVGLHVCNLERVWLSLFFIGSGKMRTVAVPAIFFFVLGSCVSLAMAALGELDLCKILFF